MIRIRKCFRICSSLNLNLLSSLPALLISLLASWCSSSRAELAVAIGQNFTASTYRVDSPAVPPDSEGVAGPLHYVELVNGRFSVFTKSNGAKVKTMTDVAFWNAAGITLPSGWDVTDPRVIYDPGSQRWFASQVDFDTSGTINTNRFLLAVSATADPTGSWEAVFIPSDPGGNDFADFPTLGIDSEGVYLSGDMFPDANSNPVGPTLVSIPKASLLTSPPTTTGMKWFGVLSYTQRGEILQPVICLDGSGAGTVLSTDSIGIDNSGNFVTNDLLVLTKITNVTGPGTPALITPSTQLTVPPYTVPLDPAQPDGSTNLDDGDARFSASVYLVGGILYAVHGTQVGNLAAIQWFRINAANQTVLESGIITDPVKDLYYPSIAANSLGTVVIGFNGSSRSTFVSGYAMVGNTVDGVTTFGQPILLKSGTASYQNTDSTGTSRWGDYSATCVDPADPTVFWTIQGIATGPSTWSTQVTELLTGVPNITAVSAAGSNLQLSWTGTLFSLQMTADLGNPSWTTITPSLATTNNGVVTAQVPISAAKALLRLQAP